MAVEGAVGAHGDAVTLDHVRVEHLAFVGGEEPVLGASLAVRVLRVGVRRAHVSGKERKKKLAKGFLLFFLARLGRRWGRKRGELRFDLWKGGQMELTCRMLQGRIWCPAKRRRHGEHRQCIVGASSILSEWEAGSCWSFRSRSSRI